MNELGVQLDIALRMVVASVVGAAIGFEREVSGHAAGMRTHLLVSLGSSLFTILSIFGFPATPGAPLDPSRVAAQIVSGIGFLGAGAIIKEGFSVKGLTTAASLWATAAVGMAAGAAQHVIAVVAAAIIVFSLWPLSRVEDRLMGKRKGHRLVRLRLATLDELAAVSKALTDHGLAIESVKTEAADPDEFDVDVGIRVRGDADLDGALAEIERLAGVRSTGVLGGSDESG